MATRNYAKGRRNAPDYTIRTIWGIAKGKELALDEESLYQIIHRETGKDSIKALTQKEINQVCSVLSEMKDKAAGKKPYQKPTHTNGNRWTEAQRAKIYMLTEDLGWNNDNNRINGFVRKLFQVERIEWLNEEQCSRLIETLKSMVAREQAKREAEGRTPYDERD